MKRIVFSLILSLFISSCSREITEIRNSIYVSELVDVTDSLVLKPDASSTLSLYDLANDPAKEVFFRQSTISDMLLNPAVEFHLSDGVTTEKENTRDDPHYRDKLILSFYTAVRKSHSDFNKNWNTVQSLKHSECFRGVAQEIVLLKTSEVKEKILLVFSDLQENSDLFNCYKDESQKLLHDNPKNVSELLNRDCQLPESLLGITIYFLYKPTTREQDQKFHTMIEVYKNMLQTRHAKVIVQADNNYSIE